MKIEDIPPKEISALELEGILHRAGEDYRAQYLRPNCIQGAKDVRSLLAHIRYQQTLIYRLKIRIEEE